MQHLKVIITTFILTVFVTPLIASPISEAQKMLNQLGYNAGPVDGAYGNKTRKAIEQFYKSIGSSFDGTLDNNELSDLIKQISLKGIATSISTENKNSILSKKAKRALAGIDIENDSKKDFFKPPQNPFPPAKLYSWGGGDMWRIADFNNDGLFDVIYIGTMNLSNSTVQCTYQVCSDKQINDAAKPLPALYLRGTDGNLRYSPKLLIDNRDNKGMALGRQILIADYNNDKVADIYIADHGVGKPDGYRDSYFLSQPDGLWLESSNTHLSHSNFKVYDHGAATGDIDNDGDIDVVITTMGSGLQCLINDGTGFLKKRKCGGSFAFALELADMDGDGDLDAIVGGHEYNLTSSMFTGIHWNNGRGNFSKNNKTRLPQHKKKWGVIPELSAWDLDNDGDMDIALSRTGSSYKGSAVQIIENLGNKKFKDRGIIQLDSNDGWVYGIRFRDMDKDGDNDLFLSSYSAKTSGVVVINNGNFDFTLVMPAQARKLYKTIYSMIYPNN